MKFTQREIKDLVISWILLSVAFAIFRKGGLFRLLNRGYLSQMPFYTVEMLIVVGTAFVLHELSHKFVAQKYGLWAEYRKWDWGLIMAFLLAVTGFFFFAAPGAVVIMSMGWITPEIEAKTSLAGPVSNIAVGTAAILMRTAGYFPIFLGDLAAINFFLALFNLIPLYPMDGSKVIRYSVLWWGGAFVMALAGLYLGLRF